MITSGRRSSAPVLQAFCISMANDISNFELLSRKRNGSAAVESALGDLGVDLDRMRRAEPDAAFGNVGLGRLAACLMESMASLGIPARGYGIRYDHGLFRQVIRDGWQMEFAENCLSFGNPWEFARPEFTYDIHYGGRVETATKGRRLQQVWGPDETVEAGGLGKPGGGWGRRPRHTPRPWVGP